MWRMKTWRIVCCAPMCNYNLDMTCRWCATRFKAPFSMKESPPFRRWTMCISSSRCVVNAGNDGVDAESQGGEMSALLEVQGAGFI